MSRKQIDTLRKQRDQITEKIEQAKIRYIKQKSTYSLKKRVAIISKVLEYCVDGCTMFTQLEFDENNPTITVSLISGPNKDDDICHYLSILFPNHDVVCEGIEQHRDDEDYYTIHLTGRTITEIKGDLLDQKGYLFQQCNCVTTKGKGLSHAFIDRFGPVADLYERRGRGVKPSIPGTYEIVKLNDEQIMVGVYGQWLPGKPGYKKCQTPDSFEDRLSYFRQALTAFAKTKSELPVYFPYRIGCGLAGGDWKLYKAELDRFALTYSGATFIVNNNLNS